MRGLACVALLALPLAAAAGEPDEPSEHGAPVPAGVLVLRGARARDQVLVDALRIYTRDLGRTVQVGGPAPAALDPGALGGVAAQGRVAGAEVVVWFAPPPIALLYALSVATLEVRETSVEEDDPQAAARALALKVRALLVRRSDALSWHRTPVPSPSPSPAPPADEPPPSPAVPLAAPPSPEPAAATAPELAVVRPAPAVASPPRFEATVAYGVTVPTSPDWVRHGLTIRLTAPWGRWPVAAFADVAFTTAPSTTVDARTVAARIWPVGVGVELRLRRPRWQLAGGPRASLQIVDAAASGAGSARRYSAGLGGIAEAAWLFSRHVAAVASVLVEALVPRQAFTAGGPNQTDLGWVQLGFTAGLLFSL